jgi:hypothetical protein
LVKPSPVAEPAQQPLTSHTTKKTVDPTMDYHSEPRNGQVIWSSQGEKVMRTNVENDDDDDMWDAEDRMRGLSMYE